MTDAEIILAAAEKVMGWSENGGGFCIGDDGVLIRPEVWPRGVVRPVTWNPLGSIEDAWMLALRMADLGYNFNMQHMSDVVGYLAQFYMDDNIAGECRDAVAPLAITNAALRCLAAKEHYGRK